jgi:hypothetical protein
MVFGSLLVAAVLVAIAGIFTVQLLRKQEAQASRQ